MPVFYSITANYTYVFVSMFCNDLYGKTICEGLSKTGRGWENLQICVTSSMDDALSFVCPNQSFGLPVLIKIEHQFEESYITQGHIFLALSSRLLLEIKKNNRKFLLKIFVENSERPKTGHSWTRISNAFQCLKTGRTKTVCSAIPFY